MQDRKERNRYRDTFETINGSVTKLRRSTAKQRIAQLSKLENYLLQPSTLDRICAALHKDLGKSKTEALASEIMVAIHSIRYIRRHLKQWMKPISVGKPLAFMGTRNYVYHESRGASLIISPWNYPFQLAINPISYAIAAGCPFILKPSEYSTSTSDILVDIVENVLSPSEGQVLLGNAETAKALLELPFDHIYFTGSTAVGKLIMKAASENLSSVTLELGGKSPCIIHTDAPVDQTCQKIVWGKLYNNGQTCIAPDHLYVPRSKQDTYVHGLKNKIKALYGTDTSTNPDYGHIISERHYQRAIALLQDAQDKGAQLISSGSVDAVTKHIPPTLVIGVTSEMQLMQEEIFAPILPIIAYDDIDTVLVTLQDRPKPLAMYIMAKNKKWINKVVRNTSAGTTVINDFLIQYANHELPFGGVNNSGIGKSHGRYGYLAFTNQRSVVEQRWSLTKIVHPPYSAQKEKLIQLMMRWMG